MDAAVLRYGCHNRPPLRDTNRVQAGWMLTLKYRIVPRMAEIPDPMTKDCQYTLSAPTDPKCEGCKHQKGTDDH